MQIFEKWDDVPEELHAKPRLDNGLSVIVFDNQTEFEAYITTNKQWNKEAYVAEINEAHSEWYRKIYTRKPDLDYSGIGEIGLYLNHPDFGAQAQALQQLWWDSVEILYAHLETVTEATALPIEAFISSLPTFTN